MTDYADFWQRLDAVLRTLDVKQVQDFLMAEGQILCSPVLTHAWGYINMQVAG